MTSGTTGVGSWQQVEIELTAERGYANPYTDVDVWAEFVHESGVRVRRPAFWDGDQTWRVRFASPGLPGDWSWTSGSSTGDPGLTESGSLTVGPTGEPATAFEAHGFWRMSPGGRSLVHANGTPALLCADTAWAMPWRATLDQVRTYAADRQAKGFNAALLMSVQPDMGAVGPRDRTADEGFDVGFDDLPEGRLTRLVPAYFQHFDGMVGILREHGIVPVLQPVFFGFGWKGLDVAGPVVPLADYARYCRYLVARYGAGPAIWLVGADGSGLEPQVEAGGAEVERWDDYRQPTGVHYRPHSTNRAHQDAPWLDFQWCQTGHRGEHAPERVADMWRNLPVKAVANGEPTYENSGETGKGAGWWQGHEAWSNLCAGGTMGVVYGAGSMWQWLLRPDEPGHSAFFTAPGCGWRDALDFEGSAYIGLLTSILAGLPTTDMAPSWDLSLAPRGLLGADGDLYISYGEHGGELRFLADVDLPRAYRVVDPQTGKVVASGVREAGDAPIPDPGPGPLVYLCYRGWEQESRGE